jgi:hypothetical protein
MKGWADSPRLRRGSPDGSSPLAAAAISEARAQHAGLSRVAGQGAVRGVRRGAGEEGQGAAEAEVKTPTGPSRFGAGNGPGGGQVITCWSKQQGFHRIALSRKLGSSSVAPEASLGPSQ